MGLHESDTKARLIRFLDRKTMPRRLEGKPVALDDEIGALVAATARHAPRGADALAEWWPAFEASLGEMCGGMWPTEKEISDAGRKHARAVRSEVADTDMSPAAINARRMARGESVGEHFIWGSGAVEMAAGRMVSEEVMNRYRSSWFFELVKLYGEDKAREMEAKAKARHEAAKVAWRHRNDPRKPHATRAPIMRAPILDVPGPQASSFARAEADASKPATPHWTEVTPPEDPAWRILQAARANNPLMAAASENAQAC